MSTLQIRFETPEQWQAVLEFLRKMKLEFKVLESDETWADQEADGDSHDAYKASQMALAEEWDRPENDHWN